MIDMLLWLLGIFLLWAAAGFVWGSRLKGTVSKPKSPPRPQEPPREAIVWMIDGEPTMEYMAKPPRDRRSLN